MDTNRPLSSNSRTYRMRFGVHKPYSQLNLKAFKKVLNKMDKPKTLRNIFSRTFRKLKGKYLTKKTLNRALKTYKNKTDKELKKYRLNTLKTIENSRKNLKRYGHNAEKAKELKRRIYEELEVYRTLETILTARKRNPATRKRVVFKL